LAHGCEDGRVISCRNLTKQFGNFTAVAGLTFEVEKGAICACLGPNGAGKSTTVKMLTGLLAPTSGEAVVCGFNPATDATALKKRIGVLPEDLGLFDDLSVIEHLRLTGDVYGLTRTTSDARIEQLIAALRLEPARRTFAGRCSHGTRKKTALAMALLPNPEALFLDEPFEAIDPVTSRAMRDILIAAASHGVTVFLTSHILPVAEEIATQFLMIREGRIVWQASAAEVTTPLEQIYFENAESAEHEGLPWLGV
jgi:ABC-2 type transport system ATP-binding protein